MDYHEGFTINYWFSFFYCTGNFANFAYYIVIAGFRDFLFCVGDFSYICDYNSGKGNTLEKF